RAGRIADGFVGSSSGTSGIEGFVQAKQLALEARAAAGGSDDFDFALHVPVYATDDGDPWEQVKHHYHYLRWKYPDMGAARGKAVATSPPPLTPDIEAQLRPTMI